MHRVLLLGAGKIGRMIAKLLSQAADYDVIVGDVSEQALERIHRQSGVGTRVIDARNQAGLQQAIEGRDTVISALDFRSNPPVAAAAVAAGLNYFDLTEDVETTRRVREIAGGVPARPCGHAAVRTGAGLHLHCRVTADQGVRCDRYGAHAGRRAASVPIQRAEIQPDLVHRWAHQRVLQPL